MNTKTFNKILLGILFLAPGFLIAGMGPLSKTEFKKEIKKEYSVNPTDRLNINNRYGEVNIKTWDQDKVNIEVTIVVQAKNQETADEVFKRISIDFNQGGGEVRASTEIESKKSSWGSWLWGDSGKAEWSINYMVHMPAQHSLTLANKYGHSYVESFSGDGDMNIKYGNLNAANVGGDFDIYLGYGNATVGSVGKTNGQVKYAKLVMEKCADATMDIKYSKWNVDEAGSVRLTSGYDDINFGTVNELSGYAKYGNLDCENLADLRLEGKYTDIDIVHLTNSADINLGYGGITIEHIKSGFSNIDIESKYAGIKLGPDSDAAYAIDASVTYAGIKYPEGLTVERDINESHTHKLSGYHKTKSGGKIRIKSSYGSIKIY
ncbi:MAG: hypothetical protein HKN16_12750 [Saprospiraceae bacterium]|nr:hypothetical protein [Saprospiraceae bacterium]